MRVRYLLIAMSVLFAVGVLASSSRAEIDPESVAAMWLLDEGEDNIVEDSSGNGHEGTIAGGTKRITGKFGEALEFVGGDSVQIPDDERLNFGTDSFSVVLWFSFSTPQDWNRLVREREPSPWGSGNYGWEIQTEGVMVHFSLDDKAGNHQRTNYADVGDGEWHHGAMVVNRDKELLITYLDGENEKMIDIANIDSVTGTLPVTIGGGFIGAIDEVGIFNVVLTQDDVVEIMNKGLSEAIGAGAAVSPSAKLTTTWGRIKDSE
jgi:hypothetical protein